MYLFQYTNNLHFNKVILFISAFCLGVLVSYFFLKFDAFSNKTNNTGIVTESAEVPSIQEEKSHNLVYRNTIFGLVFLYPSEAYSEIKENQFSDYGKNLGINVPYQEITLALDGNVSLKIWNKSQLNRILQEKRDIIILEGSTFSEEIIQQLPENEKQFIFQSGEFIIQGSIDITRVQESELGESFINSFRLLNYTDPSTNRWQTYESEHYTFLYPNDWFVEADSTRIRMYSVTELEEEEYSQPVRGYGLVTYETINLEYLEEDFATWLEKQIPRVNAVPEEYIKSQQNISLGENIFRSVELCNVGGEHYKGISLERGQICRSLSVILPSTGNGLLNIYNVNNPLVDPTTKTILENITFK